MIDAIFNADFGVFFANNPDLIERGISRQRDAFRDFDFHFHHPMSP